MNEFISKFAEVLSTRTMFSWIFGRQMNTGIRNSAETLEDLDYPIEDKLLPEETYPFPVRSKRY